MFNDNILANPFPGLRAFEEEEDVLFFGREKQIDELLRKLRTSRFLAIIGSSGSGKSSLVKSGLLPSLHSGLMSGVGSQWRIALFRPGSDPIGQLNEALSKDGVLRDEQSEDEHGINLAINESILRRSNLGLIEAYKQSGLDKKNNLLILVDQFEELFRFSKYEKDAKEGKRDSIAFINLLLMASEQKEFPIYVVFTMRSDFLGDCTEFRGLPEAINEGQYLVPRMTRDERREAITGPIAVGGATISAALLNRLLNDVGDNPDQLPILQHALMRTWDAWKRKNKPDAEIDIQEYESIGTISEALSQHAEEAYAELSTDKERQICEKIFKELTDKGGMLHGIRRPRLLSELSVAANATEEEVKKVIEIFRKPGRGFLMPAYPVSLEADSIIDISHESLMRVWDRLISWLDEEDKSAQLYVRLCEAANKYEQGLGGLWRVPELQLALKWKEEEGANALWASRYNNYFEKSMLFLQHSKHQHEYEIKHKEDMQRQRLRTTRRVSVVVSIVAFVAFLLAIFAFGKKNEATEAQKQANIKKEEALKEKKRADENKEIALHEKAIALAAEDSAKKSAAYALLQKEYAEGQKKLAEQQKGIATSKSIEALRQKLQADSAKLDAMRNEQIARENAELAKANEEIAKKQKDTSASLKDLAEARNIANQAIMLYNEGRYNESMIKARKAYELNKNAHEFNKKYAGYYQNQDIYQALNVNWAHTVKNISYQHNAPIRAITGIPGTSFIFSGDESGLLLSSYCENGLLKPTSKVQTRADIRALALSPDSRYLLAVLPDSALLYTVNADKSLTRFTKVTFPGKGKRGAFLDNGHWVVLSSNGITRFQVTNSVQPSTDSLAINGGSALTVTKNGHIYIASGRSISEYSGWNSIRQSPKTTFALKSSITSLTADESGDHLAAGTYDGTVWIKPLKTAAAPAILKIHRSSVNELRFSSDADGNLQLASASGDKMIKLMNVNSVLGANNEEIITLNGHSSWVYSIYYVPGGRYLFSGSEDRFVIGWNTTMSGLYKTLSKR